MTGAVPPYVELQVTTNYSFLRGASHVEELFAAARVFGYDALAVTDWDSLAGIARAHARAAEIGLRLVVGCRLNPRDALPLLLFPTDRPAWSRLCRLLTDARARPEPDGAGKPACELRRDQVAARGEGSLAVLLPDEPDAALGAELSRLARDFPGRGYLALTLRRRPNDQVRLRRLCDMARAAGVPTVATGDVLYHAPGRRILQDVVTCIREGCTIDAAGFRRERFADRHLKPPEEMARLFRDHPEALARTREIAGRCRFSLSELRYQYPDEAERPGETAQRALERLVWAAAPSCPGGLSPALERQLRHELGLIAALDYAPYFLTVHSIVRYARSRDILCQGRGSAANSAVCYVLRITAIDPVRSGLLFERFVSSERHEPPDIDVDFEHDRREEVIRWVFERYGRARAALCATVMRFRSRGAVRDVGKVLGLTEDVTGALASQVWGWSEEGVQEEHAAALNLNLSDRRLRMTLGLARELIGFPRQLGTHPGGFVLTADRLDELVPIEPAAMEGRQVIVWDKDDIDGLRWMKVDVLGLGMLGCMRRAFDLLAERDGREPMDLAAIPPEDPATYAMISRADTLGTFQIESRAQMSMLPRLKPRTLYDLVIQVAIVRPGPIQGDMVHPYLRRREGKEPVHYPRPELEAVLGKTLGVPLFQEQAMQVAIRCAGFTPGEADALRRSMATFKSTGGVSHFRDKLIEGMVANGYARDFAERMFRQLEGFGSYGFPESHAASFAIVAYASSWMKCHHPDVFCAALLNAQPMGFYAPAQVVRDAREHGVEIRAVCVNASRWDCTLEPRGDGKPGSAVRLGLRMARGLSNAHAAAIVGHRGEHPYRSIEELWRRSGVPPTALERLADADAFAVLGSDRRAASWQVRALAADVLPLFAGADDRAGRPRPELVEPAVPLPPMRDGQEVVEDYRAVGLSLRRHPVAFLRDGLARRGMVRCADLAHLRDGRRVVVPGIVLVRQKPGSARGVMFITVEDETGVANLILWPDRFERQRSLVLSAGMIACHGRVQREGEVVHVVTDRLEDLSAELRAVGAADGPFPLTRGRGDGATHPAGPDPRDGPGAWPDPRPDRRPGSGIRVPTRDFR